MSIMKALKEFFEHLDKTRCRNCYTWVRHSEIVEDYDPLAYHLRNDTTIVEQCKKCYNDSHYRAYDDIKD